MAFPFLLVLGALVLVAVMTSNATRGVDRDRVERFAARQHLVITAANGGAVIRYLAVTRRWRSAGLILAVVVATGWGVSSGHAGVQFLHVFVGWFLGAVAAEWAIADPLPGAQRTASLTPRALRQYVPSLATRIPYVAVVVSVAITVVAAVSNASFPVAQLAGITVASAVATVAVAAVQRRVLERPQPFADPDVIAADDAIRSRSLHVLTGCAAALTLYCIGWQCNILVLLVDSGTMHQLLSLGTMVGFLGALAAGPVIALQQHRVERSVQVGR